MHEDWMIEDLPNTWQLEHRVIFVEAMLELEWLLIEICMKAWIAGIEDGGARVCLERHFGNGSGVHKSSRNAGISVIYSSAGLRYKLFFLLALVSG